MILSSGLTDVPDKSRVQIADAVIKPSGIGSRILARRLSHIRAMELFSTSEMLEDAAALAGFSGGGI